METDDTKGQGGGSDPVQQPAPENPQGNAPGVGSLPKAPQVPVPEIPLPQKSFSAPLDLSHAESGAIAGEIAKILDEVKLPERKDARGAVDIPKVVAMPKEAPTEKAVSTTIGASPPNDPSALTSLHTLKDDLQSVVRDQKISVVRAAALEEDRRARQAPTQKIGAHTAQNRRTRGILIVVGVLALLGFAAIAGVFMIQDERGNSNAAHIETGSLLFSEQTIPFPMERREPQEIKRLLADARTSAALTLGAITRIAPTIESVDAEGVAMTRLATTQEFLEGIGAGAPDELLRALSSEFFFGFHTVDENAPILIVPVSSYERAFAGMLAWEETMNAGFSPIFTNMPALILEDGLLKKRPFVDLVMKNYDVRALEDDSGEVQLYYSFPTREILVIAESPYSFTEILSRLRADRQL